MRVNEKHVYTPQDGAATDDTVVHFPNGHVIGVDAASQPQDKMFGALEYLFPHNKILTTGLPLDFDENIGLQIAQIAAVKRNDSYADVFFLLRIEDASHAAGYAERVLPMNGFRPEAAHAYIQRFVMQGKPLAIPSQCVTADEHIAVLELRGVLLASLR